MPSEKIIALLTDFGNDDPFVGIMKGVIANISPQAKLIDITHNISPGDIRRAAVMLWQSLPYFPSGTIFLTVVDPGVGTHRKGMIAKSGNHVFVGPDNGVFSFVGQHDLVAWELSDPQFQLPGKGHTFHGRDVFAPAAAYTASGIDGQQFGARIKELVRLTNPQLEFSVGQLQGEILYSDQFGNLLTSLGCFIPADGRTFRFNPWIEKKYQEINTNVIAKDKATMTLPGGKTLRWVDTFSDLAEGELGFLIGSSGLIEIVANRNEANKLLRLNPGDQLSLEF